MSSLLKNSIITVFLFLLLINASWGQDLPGDWNTAWAVDAADSQNVLITFGAVSSTLDELFLTQDGGQNWVALSNPAWDATIVDLSMSDAKHIWIGTGHGRIYASNDAGVSWVLQYKDSLKTEFINYIEMFDSLNGVAMGDAVSDTLPAVFLKTTDGGQNWLSVNTQAFGGFSGDLWRRLDFVSMDVGYFYECCTGSQRFYKTIDGGATWTTITEPDPLTGPQVLKFYDENYGLVISQSAQIERTLDGGQTWETFNTGHSGWGNDIEFDPFNPSRVWFTDHKSVHASYDSGRTWRQFDWRYDDLEARDIAFNSAGNAWILGDNGNLIHKDWLKKYNHNKYNEDYDYIATNDVLMWFANNGDGAHDPYTDGNGLFWPKGSNTTKSAIFEDGLLWGGVVDGDTVVHGSTYRQGLQPGNILADGTAADPANDRFRIWRANAGWPTFNDYPAKLRAEYDWNNWPADFGAPFIDDNGNGSYDPKQDSPEILGDEMYWMVMNDLDSARTQFLYGSNPVGVEIQLSIYAYFRDNALRDIVFKKYKLINKSGRTIKNMYLSFWSDPDLGDAGDDVIGCDTNLDLGYCYNGDNDDYVYGLTPPAVGYTILQGPVVKGQPTDSAYIGQNWRFGYKNIGMNSFINFTKSFSYPDPTFGIIEGSYENYRYMRGINYNGDAIINPVTNEPTSFMVDGDPVNGTGWYEGDGWPGGPAPSDRRMMLSAGPFDFAPGDSQEVVYAIIMAQGEDRLDSVNKLKRKAAAVREFYYTGILPTAIEDQNSSLFPFNFSLSQNYPNPFNPATVISYELKMKSDVILIVYDVLGREVKTLVNKTQQAGKHNVIFNASNLASGVYYYKLKTKIFVQTRKMLLLR